MRIAGLALAVSLAVASTPLMGQETKGRVEAPGRGDDVRVRGCLNGPILESIETVVTDEVGKSAGPMTYQLRGNKDLLKQLRMKHDGEQVEVIGTLKSTLPQDDAARSKKVGKTRISIGVGTPTAERGVPSTHSALPVLEVKSYDGAGARCAR